MRSNQKLKNAKPFMLPHEQRPFINALKEETNYQCDTCKKTFAHSLHPTEEEVELYICFTCRGAQSNQECNITSPECNLLSIHILQSNIEDFCFFVIRSSRLPQFLAKSNFAANEVSFTRLREMVDLRVNPKKPMQMIQLDAVSNYTRIFYQTLALPIIRKTKDLRNIYVSFC